MFRAPELRTTKRLVRCPAISGSDGWAPEGGITGGGMTRAAQTSGNLYVGA